MDRLTPTDLDLLRTYEPAVRFTKGELFLPTAVGPYVEQCSLWTGIHGERQSMLAPRGEMNIERLAREGVAHRDRPLFLRFVEKPLGRREYVRWRQLPRERLSAVGRFTTTGVFGRLIDAALRGSLLLRGKVPAGLAAAAETMYREQLDSQRFTYYGRVVRDGGYLCLQYWYFYAMNDWRSTFGGINDHEADWEMVTVYVADPGGEGGSAGSKHAPSDGGNAPAPAWVAFSSHDYHGDDPRRRWDDPDLIREGSRPVVFAGAGSHSGAFIAGDYVIKVDPPQVRALIGWLRQARRLLAPWRHYTGAEAGLGIPFVDYARGDGVAIGPGHEHEWSPVLIDDETSWVRDYRGLWGLDTRDRFGGERAPSGPRYERDGSVRTSWANPLGWAGLLKVPPDERDAAQALQERADALALELDELDAKIDADRAELRGVRAQVRALRAQESTRKLADTRAADLAQREAALNQTIAERTNTAEERRAYLATLAEPLQPEPPQAHIRRSHRPHVSEQERRTRFLRAWAALSTPLLLVAVIVALIAAPLAAITTVVVLFAIFTGVEAIARRRLLSFLGSTLLLVATIGLAVGLVLLFLKHWRTAIAVLLGAAALTLLLGNLRDLRRG